MYTIRKLLTCLIMVVMLTACFGVMSAATAEAVQLQVLATSDMHGRFVSYDYALNAPSTSGSCTQLATAIAALRTENTILVDGGDIIQDNSSEMFLQDDMHPMMLAMNEMGYDAWIVGNHEFNYGLPTLKRIIQQNNAPLLCGNVLDENGDMLGVPYIIIEKSGVKIALIGMVTPNIVRWDAENLKNSTVLDPVTETRKVIDALKGQVDVLIAVEHMMLDNEYDVPDSGATDLANACPELDLIIAAHGHQAIGALEINGVPIVENKNSGATMAQILMDVEKTEDGWQVTNVTTGLVNIQDYEEDAALNEKLQPYHERAVVNAETVIGSFTSEYLAAPDEIPGIPTAQIEDTALIDLINEVQMYYTGAKVSGTALFVSNANLYAGDIRKCDMALIYKYSNTLYKLEMTGAQLKAWMEWSVSYYNTYTPGDLTISFNEGIRGYNYDMFSGVLYEVNIAKEPGDRIENLTWPDGTPVQMDEVFLVAANNYRSASHLATYGEIFHEGEALPKIL